MPAASARNARKTSPSIHHADRGFAPVPSRGGRRMWIWATTLPIVAARVGWVVNRVRAQASTRSTVTPTEDTGMELAVLPLLFLIVPAALALAAIFGLPRLLERRRQNAYAAFCLTRGYQYLPSRTNAEAQYADVVGMFKTGGSHKWRDEISGMFNGRAFTAFEYQYATGAGRFR